MSKRVLYVMPNAVAGGAERATMLMLASHDRRRYDPAVLFFADGPLVDDARKLGITVHVLGHAVRLRHPASVARTLSDGRRLVGAHGYSLFVDADALVAAFDATVADITDPE